MPTPEQIKNIHQAFLSGKMTPEEALQWQDDIDVGIIKLPSDIITEVRLPTIKVDQDKLASGDPIVLPQSVIDARDRGEFSPSEEKQFQEDLATGRIKLPEPGFFANLWEMISGVERTTPEVDAMETFRVMPEKTQLSLDAFMASLGTLTAGPNEVVQIMKSRFPEIEVRQDEKGNYIFKSAIDGKEYAFKPGLKFADVATAFPAIAAFISTAIVTGGGMLPLILSAMGVETGIQTSQKAAGGKFDFADVALAGITEALGVSGSKITKAVGGAIKKKFGKEVIEEVVEVDLHKLMREASKGKPKAISQLAEKASVDPKIAEAAEILGIDLTSGQTTTSQAYRQIHGAVESMTGSQTAIASAKAKEQLAKKAVDIIEEAGGLKSMNQMNVNLRSEFNNLRFKFNDLSDKIYKEIATVIEPKTPAPAENLISFLKKQADDLGGIDKLDVSLQKLLKNLSPKKGKPPTYAYLESKRKELTRARVKIMEKSEFSNVDKRMLLKLENELMKDQKSLIKFTGKLDQFEKAQGYVAIRKAMEKDMEALFGKDLGGSIVGKLSKSMKGLSQNDAEQFIKLIKKIPEDIRKEVVATGLQSAFARNTMGGSLNVSSYTKWYEGMIKNKQARNALFVNLPTGMPRSLKNVYRVSKGIDNISKNFIATGKLTEARIAIEGADTLMNKIWDMAAKLGIAIPFVKAMKSVGAPSGVGIGLSVASALQRKTTKSSVVWAVDDLLSSNEFINLVRHQTPEAAARLAKTGAWKTFFKALGKPRELSTPERWMLSAFQIARSKMEQPEKLRAAQQKALLQPKE